jgi:LysR family transcriptional regulator (chromosome initiation inhibitor)
VTILLDYDAIAALSHVIETQSFLYAADKLCITQSAISQRIKSIERYYGEPVLIRTIPYRATPLGLVLLGHYERVCLLESSLQDSLSDESKPHPFAIAISRDSLETWFMSVILRLKSIGDVRLKVIADDQEVTLEHFKNGLVSACASTSNKALPGCAVTFLGYLDYVLVSSPAFFNQFFAYREPKAALVKAPTMVFDHKDQLHAQYLKKFFNLTMSDCSYHVVPSVAGFKQFALYDHAYALMPRLDVTNELAKGTLVNIFPDKIWRMPIYWHTWAIETKHYCALNQLVKHVAQQILSQSELK